MNMQIYERVMAHGDPAHGDPAHAYNTCELGLLSDRDGALSSPGRLCVAGHCECKPRLWGR